MTMQRIDEQAAVMTAIDVVLSREFQERVRQFRDSLYGYTKAISKTDTPAVDGNGNAIIRRRPDGFDFVPDHFMRDRLDYWFPGWSWLQIGQSRYVGPSWPEFVAVNGTLRIIVPEFLAMGIVPPYREFSCGCAKRVTFKSQRGKDAAPHGWDTIVDLKNDEEAVNTMALKKCINMLTHICDDVYKKRVEEEGMGSYFEVFQADPSWDNLVALLPSLGLDTLSMLRLLACQSPADLDVKYTENYMAVYQAIMAAKGGGGTQDK
jgi:hypothetical protein